MGWWGGRRGYGRDWGGGSDRFRLVNSPCKVHSERTHVQRRLSTEFQLVNWPSCPVSLSPLALLSFLPLVTPLPGKTRAPAMQVLIQGTHVKLVAASLLGKPSDCLAAKLRFSKPKHFPQVISCPKLTNVATNVFVYSAIHLTWEPSW